MTKGYVVNDKIGNIIWYNENNLFHREDGPAIEYANGRKAWYINGKRHREDGPAIEFANGDTFWYYNDELHRLDGPAKELRNGTKYWIINDKLHRLDGPAIEWVEHYWKNEYWVNGIQYTDYSKYLKAVDEYIIVSMLK